MSTSMYKLIHNQLELLPSCNYLCHTWCHLHVMTDLVHLQYPHLVMVDETAQAQLVVFATSRCSTAPTRQLGGRYMLPAMY